MRVILGAMFKCCQMGTLEIISGEIDMGCIHGARYHRLPHWLSEAAYDKVDNDVAAEHRQLCHRQIMTRFATKHPDMTVVNDICGKHTPRLVFKW